MFKFEFPGMPVPCWERQPRPHRDVVFGRRVLGLSQRADQPQIRDRGKIQFFEGKITGIQVKQARVSTLNTQPTVFLTTSLSEVAEL